MQTIELVKANSHDLRHSESCLTQEQVEHNKKAKKLNRVLTQHIPTFKTPHDKVGPHHTIDLEKHGFYWTVNSSFVTKFQYHAVLTTSHQHTIFRSYKKSFFANKSREQFFYVGDIPDGAIDRIMEIKKCGFEKSLTIHSNEFLPIVKQEIPQEIKKVDPVVLAWNDEPFIRTGVGGKGVLSYNENAVAVVVAVWNYDEEFPL